MRTRYVVCVALLAALAGAAARYAWPYFRASLEEARAPEPAVEYRKIADALSRVCGWVEEHRLAVGETNFELLRHMEANWDAETRRFAGRTDLVRRGPRLTIKAGSKTMDFIDYGYFCHDPDSVFFNYHQQLPKARLHVLLAHYYESASAVLVSVETDHRAYTFTEVIESPSGKRIVASTPERGLCYHCGYEILRVEGGRTVSELFQSDYGPAKGASPELFPSPRFRQVVGWIDDETLLLLLSEDQQITLDFRDGRWQLKEPLPQ